MLTEINLLNSDFYSNFTRVFMWNFHFYQGNHFVMGVSERKGDRSVTVVLERKRNGGLHGSNQRGSNLLVNNLMISIFGFSGAP